MAESLINLTNADRSDDQTRVYQEIARRGECPFCIDNLHKSHQQPIIREGEHWLITPNQWPYRYTATHLLAITKKHVMRISDFGEEAGEVGAELFTHISWAESEYKIAAGGLAMRFGDTTNTGASVAHLHAHIIQPDPGKPSDARVKFKIS